MAGTVQSKNSDPISHRGTTGRYYNNAPIHAAEGVHEQAIEILSSRLASDALVADIGAGSGAFSLRLRDRGFSSIPIDIDVSELPANIRDEGICADVCKGFDASIAYGSVDAVVALELIEHLDCPYQFIENSMRILTQGGGILISTPNILHPYSQIKFAASGKYWLFSEGAYYSTGHATPLPLWLLCAHLSRAGFVNIEFGFGGAFEVRGLRGLVVKALSRAYQPRKTQLGSKADRSTLFVWARKP